MLFPPHILDTSIAEQKDHLIGMAVEDSTVNPYNFLIIFDQWTFRFLQIFLFRLYIMNLNVSQVQL